MKNFIFSALCALGLFVAGSSAQAQETFEKETNLVNVGIGLGSTLTGQVIPPVSVGFERSVIDGILDKGSLGIGAQAEFQSFKVLDSSWSNLFIGPRVSFHYEFLENLDTYATVTAGWYKVGPVSSFAADFSVGARYLFTPSLGAFTEIGSGIAVLRAGVTFNL